MIDRSDICRRNIAGRWPKADAVLLGRVLRWAGGLLYIACLGACSPSAPSDSVRIGTSSVGSTFYGIAVAISELAYRFNDINSTVQPVGGSVPNVFALETNRLDLAIVNAYAAYLGYNGLEPFERPADIRLVLQGQRSFRHILVRRGSGIVSPADFRGRSIVADRPSNPDLSKIVQALLATYGVPEHEVQLISTSTSSQVMHAFEVGSIDAAIFPFGEGAAVVEEAARSGLVELMLLPADMRDAALSLLPPAIQGGVLPAESFSGQSSDVNTFTMNTYLLARADTDPHVVAGVAAATLGHQAEFLEYQSAARDWTIERTLEAATVPYHDGTISYLQTTGLWDAELDSRQRALLGSARSSVQ